MGKKDHPGKDSGKKKNIHPWIQMCEANMPANARYSESDRAETLSEPEGGTAEWNTEQSDSARDEARSQEPRWGQS